MMNIEARIYYFACVLLWGALSYIDFLLEDVVLPEVDRRYRQGYSKMDDVAGWLLDEVFSADEGEDIDEATIRTMRAIRSSIEDLCDTAGARWGSELRAAAHSASEQLAGVDEELCLYFFICGWTSRTLSAFDRLVKEIGVSAPAFERRYQEHYPKFGDLSRWLEAELASLDTRQAGERAQTSSLQVAIATLADELAEDWRETVYTAARDLKLEP